MLNQTFLLKHSNGTRSRHIYYTTKQQKQNKTEQNNTVGTYFTASKLSAFISRRISLLVRTQQLSSLISFLHLIRITSFINDIQSTSISNHFIHAFLPLSTLLSLDAFLSFPIISCISHFVHLPFLSITVFPIFLPFGIIILPVSTPCFTHLSTHFLYLYYDAIYVHFELFHSFVYFFSPLTFSLFAFHSLSFQSSTLHLS